MAKSKSRKRPEGQRPPPVCKAILLCDAVLTDPLRGKGSVIGIFENFVVSQFPGVTSEFCVYLQMTSGIGRYRITVEVRDVAEDATIARAEVAEVDFPDRGTKGTLVIPVPSLPLPKAGAYDLIVFADRLEIDRQQFHAVARPEPPNAANQSTPPEESG